MTNELYLAGIALALIVYMIIGVVAGRKVKDKNDYYVAGRRAPVALIVGSLIASFLSTGAFMGDAGEVYNGFFMGIVVVGIIQASGYIYGAGLFGRYIRRSGVNTVPEYFGARFASRRLRVLASVTLIVAVSAYLLSAIQGVTTLMQSITGFSYSTCVLIAWVSFTLFTVYSGSMGVLVTETVMFLVFLAAALLGLPFVIDAAGGWFAGIGDLATSQSNPGIIAWTNNLDYRFPSGMENLAWAITYGLVWAMVVAVSPWQTSRYLMAKDEHVVMRSAALASIGVIVVTTAIYFTAAFVYAVNPHLADSSTVIIWAAMNLMPTVVGVVLLTGILSAGISSASTFLSLIGFSLTSDLFSKTGKTGRALMFSRIGMGAASLVVLAIAYFNPPQIFVIMYFGGTVIASSWGIVAIASVWSKRLSEFGAFLGMLFGFLGCVVAKAGSAFADIDLPLWLDPFFVGLAASAVGMVVGSIVKKPSLEESRFREGLFIRPPDTEKEPAIRWKRTHALTYAYVAFGVCVGLFFVFMYAVPYALAE